MAAGPPKKGVWSRAFKAIPQDTLIGQFSNTPPFIPSYEHDCTVNLNFLLCYEYYRIWRREIEEHLAQRKSKGKTKKLKKPTFEKSGAKNKNKNFNKKEKVAKGNNEKTHQAKLAGEPPAQFDTCICEQF